MTSAPDLDSLRESFARWPRPGLPPTLAEDWAAMIGVTDISISFVDESGQTVLGSSSDAARTVTDWEFTFEEGPGVDAATTGASRSADTAPSPTNPWPRLSAKAVAAGYRGLAGFPWQVDGITFATVNLHDRKGPITAETVAAAQHVADQLTPLLVDSLAALVVTHPHDRDTFHEATGMVMTQMSTDVITAARALRSHAWAHDRVLGDVAADVVARTLTLSPSPG